jgi:hypothetical protein
MASTSTMKIAGYVQPGTYFNPDVIAEKSWELRDQRTEREIIYR